jgi:hypothetical protein
LLKAKADPLKCSEDGRFYALDLAKSIQMQKCILDFIDDVNIIVHDRVYDRSTGKFLDMEETLLHRAFRHKDAGLVGLLLERGADVSLRDGCGRPAFFHLQDFASARRLLPEVRCPLYARSRFFRDGFFSAPTKTSVLPAVNGL